MKLVEQSKAHRSAYEDFVRKVSAGASDAAFAAPFAYYGLSPGITLTRRLLIDDAVDPPIVVAAVNVKLQDYVVAGASVQIAVATYPVSLGLVEPRYAMAALLLFRKFNEAYPFSILLGMGPPETNVTARMCVLLGWRVRPVPYLFMARRLGPLAAKQLAARPGLARLADLAGRLKLLWPAEAALRLRAGAGPGPPLRVTQPPRFDESLDAWWQAYAGETAFSLVRNSQQMNAMFPESVPAFERLAFHDGNRLVGFAVLLVPDPEEAVRQTGVSLVTLVEYSVLQAYADRGAAALARSLFARNLDAVIANTPHAATVRALTAHGFRERITNVYLATSRALQALLDEKQVALGDMVVTRGDGDGPIGLGVDLS